MKSLQHYCIQITGPSGSGKSYFAKALQSLGYNAIDADKIEGLGKFINKSGQEVPYNHEGGIEWLEENLWVWDFAMLQQFLSQHQKLIICGGACNESEALPFFDYVFYLFLPKEEILRNLMKEDRTNPYGKTEAQQHYASQKIDEFYSNIPSSWIPLTARKVEDLIEEIEGYIQHNLER